MMTDNLSPKQIIVLTKLNALFDTVLNHLGDDNLISSCNTEYNFDQNTIFMTDGIACSYIQKAGVDNFHGRYEEIIHYETSIRGASYVIITDKSNKDGNWKYDLRIDDKYIVEKYDEIVNRLIHIKEVIKDMEYQMLPENRPSVIPDELPVDEVYMVDY